MRLQKIPIRPKTVNPPPWRLGRRFFNVNPQSFETERKQNE